MLLYFHYGFETRADSCGSISCSEVIVAAVVGGGVVVVAVSSSSALFCVDIVTALLFCRNET